MQSGLHYDQIYYLREHAASFPGVQLAQSWLRKYPYQSLAAQVLGYVGQISPQEYKQLKKSGYQPTDTIGQAGIEATYDTYLRGRDGKAQLTVDSRGRPKASTLQLQPQPGQTLRLTIDIGLQRAAERALRTASTSRTRTSTASTPTAARSWRSTRTTGRCSRWRRTRRTSRRSSRVAQIRRSSPADRQAGRGDNYPALNRAIDVGYPPGSTFKPVTALAAMQERLMQPYDLIPCTPTFTRYQQTFDNWTPLIDQAMDLTNALAESCDTYFYELGKRFYVLPPNRGHPLQGWANRFGLGEPTGVDIGPETAG